MKKILYTIQLYLISLDLRALYQRIAIALGIVIVCVSGTLYVYYRKISTIKTSIRSLRSAKEEAQLILTKLKQVEKQREEVNALLKEEKNFKIKSYFDEVVKRLKLVLLLQKEANISETEIKNNYTEISLSVHFSNINTKQLCDLINALEQKTRIYTKEIAITKTKELLDVKATFATLRLHTDTKESS